MRISDWSSEVCSSDLRSVNFTIGVTDRVAIVGSSGSGMDLLSYMLAGLIAPSSGVLRIGGRDVERLPSAVTGRRIAYVGPHAYHFAGSLRDNLLYGLMPDRKSTSLNSSHYSDY